MEALNGRSVLECQWKVRERRRKQEKEGESWRESQHFLEAGPLCKSEDRTSETGQGLH